jgi:hypothetical protein
MVGTRRKKLAPEPTLAPVIHRLTIQQTKLIADCALSAHSDYTLFEHRCRKELRFSTVDKGELAMRLVPK